MLHVVLLLFPLSVCSSRLSSCVTHLKESAKMRYDQDLSELCSCSGNMNLKHTNQSWLQTVTTRESPLSYRHCSATYRSAHSLRHTYESRKWGRHAHKHTYKLMFDSKSSHVVGESEPPQSSCLPSFHDHNDRRQCQLLRDALYYCLLVDRVSRAHIGNHIGNPQKCMRQ